LITIFAKNPAWAAQDTLKLSEVILLRISMPNCGSGSEGKGTWTQRERHYYKKQQNSLECCHRKMNAPVAPNVCRKDSVLCCIYTRINYNDWEYIHFSVGMDLCSFKTQACHLQSCMKKSKRAIRAVNRIHIKGIMDTFSNICDGTPVL
jgi:hypothetical protein